MNNLVQNYIGFDGRLNRQPFWIGGIILAVISLIISLLVLPMIGLSMIPNMNFGSDTTAADISAMVADATRKSGWISLVLFVIFVYPSAALCIKRRHDRNNSGLDVWIYLALSAISLLIQALGLGMTTTTVGEMTIPSPSPVMMVFGVIVGIYALYLLIVLGFLKGTSGPNTYGPDPLQS